MLPLKKHGVNGIEADVCRDAAAQERPCTRCIKRSIGHLCHDEPREGKRKSRHDRDQAAPDAELPPPTPVTSLSVETRPPAAEQNLAQPQPPTQVVSSSDPVPIVPAPGPPNGLALVRPPLDPSNPGQVYVGNDQQCEQRSNDTRLELMADLSLQFWATTTGAWALRISSKTCITSIRRGCSRRPRSPTNTTSSMTF